MRKAFGTHWKTIPLANYIYCNLITHQETLFTEIVTFFGLPPISYVFVSWFSRYRTADYIILWLHRTSSLSSFLPLCPGEDFKKKKKFMVPLSFSKFSSRPPPVPNPLTALALLDTFLNYTYFFPPPFLWWVWHKDLGKSIPIPSLDTSLSISSTGGQDEWSRSIFRGLSGRGVSVGRKWGHSMRIAYRLLWCSWSSWPSTWTK